MTHLLAIGLDETIARLPGDTLGDPLLRQLKYASVLETYRLVVRSLRPSRRQVLCDAGLTCRLVQADRADAGGVRV